MKYVAVPDDCILSIADIVRNVGLDQQEEAMAEGQPANSLEPTVPLVNVDPPAMMEVTLRLPIS